MIETYLLSIVLSAIALGFFALAAKVLLGVWAYLDAKERDISAAVGWGFIVALVPLFIGLIVYLAVRSSESRRNSCPSCGKRNLQEAQFCSNCGNTLSQAGYDPAYPKKSKKALVAFFICLGASVLLTVGIIVSSILNAFRFADHFIPRMGSFFNGRNFEYKIPGFDFDFDFDNGGVSFGSNLETGDTDAF